MNYEGHTGTSIIGNGLDPNTLLIEPANTAIGGTIRSKDAKKFWDFVAANVAGLKWVSRNMDHPTLIVSNALTPFDSLIHRVGTTHKVIDLGGNLKKSYESNGTTWVNISDSHPVIMTGTTLPAFSLISHRTGTDFLLVNAGGDLIMQYTSDGTKWQLVKAKVTEVDYTKLRATNGTDYEDQITIKDFTYTFDGVTYTTEGGVFYKDSVGTENGGTTIVSTDGTVWKRVRDRNTVRYQWWEVGGYNSSGLLFTNFLTEKDGVYDDNIRIIQGLSLGEKYMYLPNETINIHRKLVLNNSQELIGDKTRFERHVIGAGTTYIANGTTTITVTSSADLKVNMEINLTGSTTTVGTFTFITAISGNSVTVNNAISGTGSVYISLISVFCDDPEGVNKVEGIIFDGNRNEGQHYLNWDGNNYSILASIGTNTQKRGCEITKCEFIDIPQENIYVGVGHVHHNYARNINGSFVHMNANSTGSPAYDSFIAKEYQLIIEYNRVYDACQNASSTHSEGVITFSQQNPSVFVFRNKFYGSGKGIFGSANSDDTNFLALENFCTDAKTQIFSQNIGTSSKYFNMQFVNNTFHTCGDFEVTGSVKYGGLKIIGNKIYNSRIRLTNANNPIIKDNTIVYQRGLYGFTGFDANYGIISVAAAELSIVEVRNCNSVVFEDNTILGDIVSRESEYQHGFQYYRAVGTSNTNGVADDRYLSFKGNTIANFRKCVTFVDYSDQTNFVRNAQTSFWVIKENTIVMLQNIGIGTFAYGLDTTPGSVVTNNTVWLPRISPVNTFGILACGVHTVSTIKKGAQVMYNQVYGGADNTADASIRVGESGWNLYNSIVKFNQVDIPVEDNTAGKSKVSDNITLAVDLPLLTGYPIAPSFDWLMVVEEI